MRTPGQITAFFISLMLSAPALAGAWVQPSGKGEFIGNATYFSSGTFFDRNGNATKQQRFSKVELQPYVEYGISRSITLGGSVFLQRVEQGNLDNYGIADPEFFLRKQLYRDHHHVVSLQPLIKLPSHFNDKATPRGGSESTDVELSLLYGRNLNLMSSRDYADLRVGYRTRNDGLNDQIRADAMLGMRVADAWEIVPALRYIKATSLNSNAAFSENGQQDFDLLKAELGVNYHLSDQRSIRANVFDHMAGKQVGAGQGISLGYAAKF